MEKLKHEAVTRLIDRAVTAGNTNPSFTQLQTLALALGDRPGWEFLRHATLKDRVAIKNCIAATVYGKDPVKVCEGVGALFGMAGDDAVIAEADQARIYDVKPVERTTEDQRDIAERKQIPQEDKHPLTSDRVAPQPAVAEPLKEQTDPEFKEILNRGEKHLTEIAKETAPAKTASLCKTGAVHDVTIKFRLDGGKVKNLTEYANKISKLVNRTITRIEEDTTDIFHGSTVFTLVNAQADPVAEESTAPAKTSNVEADPEVYAKRIGKGEHVLGVLRDFAAKLLHRPKVQAVINAGDRITMSTPATGPVDVTFEAGNMTPTGDEQLVGKDGSGNVVMVLPKGTDPMKIKDANLHQL